MMDFWRYYTSALHVAGNLTLFAAEREKWHFRASFPSDTISSG